MAVVAVAVDQTCIARSQLRTAASRVPDDAGHFRAIAPAMSLQLAEGGHLTY